MSSGDTVSACAIGVTVFGIVSVSTVLGCCLPFLLRRLGFDPVHSGPIIQVAMDIVGVSLTCGVCGVVFSLAFAEDVQVPGEETVCVKDVHFECFRVVHHRNQKRVAACIHCSFAQH